MRRGGRLAPSGLPGETATGAAQPHFDEQCPGRPAGGVSARGHSFAAGGAASPHFWDTVLGSLL